ATILVSQKDAPVIVVADEGYPQGIVGLVAGRLMDEFYRPALVIEKGQPTSKGSARSIPEFNIIAALDQCADLFVKHGGHKAAAGFTLNTSRLSDLQSRLTDLARQQFDGQPPEPSIHADAVVAFRELDRPLLFLLEQLEPCGAENPPSRFVSRHVAVRSHKTMGKDGEHLRLKLMQDNIVRDGVAFRQGKAWSGHVPPFIDIVYSFEWNEYNGMLSMQLNIKDIHPSATNHR
ncbi:MAG: single-stranded-DNA-specific exonuclease RecJ, partial [Chloroflexi bacterium]|nr:single-stranded-DNA-specific exonuclease RecJ [Chloroflexota bacterium]